jgi:hypothetical protein
MTDDREIRISLDGNMWCALHGPNLQEGMSGFGDTPAEALMDLIEQTEGQFTAVTPSHETIAGLLHTALSTLNLVDEVCSDVPCDGCPGWTGRRCWVDDVRRDLAEHLSEGSP